jgi:hypothetical protein
MIIIREKGGKRQQEGFTNFDKAVISTTKASVKDLLQRQHDGSKNISGTMYPGEDKYWIDQAIGTIDALCDQANNALVQNTHVIDDYYGVLQSARKKFVTFKG